MDCAGEVVASPCSIREKVKLLMNRYDFGSRYSQTPLQQASILLPLLIRQDRLYLLLTARSMELRTMPGDVCFPGGRRESGDQDDIETALRESKEEIGLEPHQVEIVGKLVPYITRGPLFLVTPVVGIVEDNFQPSPNPNEVTDTFYVPLDFFISSDHYTPLELTIPSFGNLRLHKYVYQDPETEKIFVIYGMTAHFALLLAAILLERDPEFNPEFDLQREIQECEKKISDFKYQSKL
ncbi:peroxisomal coenzyme A diphosphatase NUDT7 [Gastrophryne carolinensis]